MNHLSTRSRLYIGAVIAAGSACFVSAVAGMRLTDPAQFTLYLLLAGLGSGMKVTLPGMRGTMSVSFVLVLLSIAQLSLGETLLIAMTSAVLQAVWRAGQRPAVLRVAFNTSSVAIAAAAGWCVHNLGGPFSYPLHTGVQLGLAAAAYYLLNSTLVVLVIALTETTPMAAVWENCVLWSMPYYLSGSLVAGLMVFMRRYWGWEGSLLLLPALYVTYHFLRLYLGRLENEKRHAQELAALHLRTIEALALAIEAKDDNTHEHLCRVQVYATELGKELGLVEQDLQALQAASILHDIGKLAVPDYIISKPGKLTPEEFEKMKIHPVVGAEILERVQFPYPVVPVVRSHHEKWDGSGYPLGLVREQIPMGARILSAVDCLDALASDRQYRRALPLDQALQVLVGESGKSFDPAVVEILVRRAAELERKARAVVSQQVPLKISRELQGGPVGAAEAGGAAEGSPAGENSKETAKAPDFLLQIAAARHEMQAFFETIQQLGNSLNLQETFSVLALRLRELVPHETIVIYQRDQEQLNPLFAQGESAQLFSGLKIPVGQGLSGWVVEKRTPILNGNPSVESGYLNDPGKFSILRSALSVPLTGMDGFSGALTLYRLSRTGFNRDHLRILLAVRHKLSVAVENAIKYQQVQRDSTTDMLTGLPNARSLFLQLDKEISRCRRSGGTLTVVVCDLDGFKLVNDRHGHLDGNRVLQLLATRFRETCRDYDSVARMGGDEFVLVIPNLPPDVLEQKLSALARIAEEVGREVCAERLLSLSTGHAEYPADGTDAEELLALADERMYQIKRSHQTDLAIPA